LFFFGNSINNHLVIIIRGPKKLLHIQDLKVIHAETSRTPSYSEEKSAIEDYNLFIGLPWTSVCGKAKGEMVTWQG